MFASLAVLHWERPNSTEFVPSTVDQSKKEAANAYPEGIPIHPQFHPKV